MKRSISFIVAAILGSTGVGAGIAGGTAVGVAVGDTTAAAIAGPGEVDVDIAVNPFR